MENGFITRLFIDRIWNQATQFLIWSFQYKLDFFMTRVSALFSISITLSIESKCQTT